MSYILRVLLELDAPIGTYGAYPAGRGYDGGLDRPLHEPNPSVVNPYNPPSAPGSPPAERSGKELYDLYKQFPGSTDDFSKGLSSGERDNFDIHRDSEVRKNLGIPQIMIPAAPAPRLPAPPKPVIPSDKIM